ncbi:ABC transporter A family member 12 [Bienertia sinuspersici]
MGEVSAPRRAAFGTQADALFRKNLVYQKRNKSQNLFLLITPLVVVALFAYLESKLKEVSAAKSDQEVGATEIKEPVSWPPALYIPSNTSRAVGFNFMPFSDLPSPSCRISGDCPATFLLTGTNRSLVMGMAEQMFPPIENPNDLDGLVLATSFSIPQNYLSDPAFDPNSPLYYLQSKCKANSSIPFPSGQELKCLEGLQLWRNSSSAINKEIYTASDGNKHKEANKFAAAFDFLNTNRANFNVTVITRPSAADSLIASMRYTITRLPRLVNMASNAYLQVLQGPDTKMLFEFMKEVPTIIRIDARIPSHMDFFLRTATVAILLYPITVLASGIVYEKEKNLRIMMKMHGLNDIAYWAISYLYCLIVSLLFIQFYLIAGKFSGLSFFTKNDYSLQSVFFFFHVNWQISFVFLLASLVSTVKTAQVIGSAFMMLVTFLSVFVASRCIESADISSTLIVFVEVFPGFSLYRGVYEFQKYAAFARNGAGFGMGWKNLSDPGNGLTTAMTIILVEWVVMLLLASYFDQVISSGDGKKKSPLFFLQCLKRNQQNLQRNSSQLFPTNDSSDVAQERKKVEQLMREANQASTSHTAICDNIKKIYPGRDGNPPKAAVKGLSLALARSECFGMLGPNGAGKTSFISMMIGLTEPTSGTAYIEGLDITTQMDEVHTCMGVCPQFDLLWDTLTGREHLYFYGRLKNLSGSRLAQAVEDALKEVNLFHGGIADKHSGKYSGGMKRRLSVAISLIGDPKIVYLDEPSTGLDPASRNALWSVVKRAKQNRAILLTTHSMEEAEALCDRLGVFVDGALRCVGNPKELKARYGGYFIFTMTTTQGNDAEVEDMVLKLCRNANKTYHLGGTQKFDLPKHEVRLADIFQLVENAKSRFPVQAWALADTTLEDVFIKVTRQAQAASDE